MTGIKKNQDFNNPENKQVFEGNLRITIEVIGKSKSKSNKRKSTDNKEHDTRILIRNKKGLFRKSIAMALAENGISMEVLPEVVTWIRDKFCFMYQHQGIDTEVEYSSLLREMQEEMDRIVKRAKIS